MLDVLESTSTLLTIEKPIVDTFATTDGAPELVLLTINQRLDNAVNRESLSVVAVPPILSILTLLSIFTYIVFIPVSISKKVPRRSVVCFASVTVSVLFSPIEPSLKLEHKIY